MNDWMILALAGLAGLLLGAMFFGGLWWTVRKGVTSTHPALWFLGSWFLRMGLAVAGFHQASGGQWERLLACLLGFIVARQVVTALARSPLARPGAPSAETGHGP